MTPHTPGPTSTTPATLPLKRDCVWCRLWLPPLMVATAGLVILADRMLNDLAASEPFDLASLAGTLEREAGFDASGPQDPDGTNGLPTIPGLRPNPARRLPDLLVGDSPDEFRPFDRRDDAFDGQTPTRPPNRNAPLLGFDPDFEPPPRGLDGANMAQRAGKANPDPDRFDQGQPGGVFDPFAGRPGFPVPNPNADPLEPQPGLDPDEFDRLQRRDFHRELRNVLRRAHRDVDQTAREIQALGIQFRTPMNEETRQKARQVIRSQAPRLPLDRQILLFRRLGLPEPTILEYLVSNEVRNLGGRTGPRSAAEAWILSARRLIASPIDPADPPP